MEHSKIHVTTATHRRLALFKRNHNQIQLIINYVNKQNSFAVLQRLQSEAIIENMKSCCM